MAKGKNKSMKQQVFMPPTRHPQNVALTMDVIKKQYDKEMTQASNNTFNLVASAMLIAAKDMGMDNVSVKELLNRCFGILDDVADDLATIDGMMGLVNSWGIEIYKTAQERTSYNGDMIAKKTAVFELLESEVTEIEDILRKCKAHGIKIDYREVCNYRWEFNRIKYYESYEKDCCDMTQKDKALAMLDTGATVEQIMEVLGVSKKAVYNYTWMWNKESPQDRKNRLDRGIGEMANKNKLKAFNMIKNGADAKDLVSALGVTEAAAMRYIETYRNEVNGGEIEIMTENMKKAFDMFDKAMSEAQVRESLQLGKATVYNYHQEWIRINKRDLNAEEMAEILAEESTADIVILRHKGVLPPKKETVKNGHKEVEAVSEKTNVVEEVKQEEVEIEVKQAVVKVEEEKKVVKLKKVVKVIEIQGEYATYKPDGMGSLDVEIGGQVITLDTCSLKGLGEELLAVSEEEL